MKSSIIASAFLLVPTIAQAQVAQQKPAAPAPAPATKMEAFTPKAGTVVTVGYDELGTVIKYGAGGAVSVDVRQIASGSDTVRGLVVTVTESQYREETAFIDADEIAELISGIDALLGITQNPTAFSRFEQRYNTKGELRITAYNEKNGIRYEVRAGRVVSARASTLTAADLQKLRTMFKAAQDKIAEVSK